MRDQASRDREGGEGKLRRRHQRGKRDGGKIHIFCLCVMQLFSLWREVHKIDGKLTRENPVREIVVAMFFFSGLDYKLDIAASSCLFFLLSSVPRASCVFPRIENRKNPLSFVAFTALSPSSLFCLVVLYYGKERVGWRSETYMAPTERR